MMPEIRGYIKKPGSQDPRQLPPKRHSGTGSSFLSSSVLSSPSQSRDVGRFYQTATAASSTTDHTKTPELIFPHPNAPTRRSESISAIFNLVATIVGGGVLSLPYAMSQTGYILGLVFLVISAISTGFALYILCSCARRTGTKSFIGVSRAAFGNYGAYFTTTILLTMTMFVLVAYMILVRDIWSGLVQFCIGTTLDEGATNLVLIICVLVTLPMCLATNLHALRHMCYVGFSSALILTVALGYRCLEYNIEYPEALFSRTVLVSPSLTQILAAFPIMSLAFMCQFNILSVHSELIHPTRERLKGIIYGSMSMGMIVYVMIGSFGYFYAYEDTRDDVLLNFEPNDTVLLLGRLGLGVTMLIAIPMLCLPSRDALMELLFALGDSCGTAKVPTGFESSNGQFDAAPKKSSQELQPLLLAPPTPGKALNSPLALVRHLVATLCLLGICLYAAVGIPGVGVVWSLCGSSMGMMIAYCMPAIFYLRIRRKKAWNIRKLGALFMLVAGLIMMVLCTTLSVRQIFSR